MTTTTMKPTAPINRADVSTWTPEQMAWAASQLVRLYKTKVASDIAFMNEFQHGSEAWVQAVTMVHNSQLILTFWTFYIDGMNPTVPKILKSWKVDAYEQTNGRVRKHKTIQSQPKDFGLWA